MSMLSDAVQAAESAKSKGIGTYMERTQHRVLKFFFEADTAYHEVPVSSYVADICKDKHIYEIQTSGFGALTPKLEVFLENYDVTVVYPAVVKKIIVWVDPLTGESHEGRAFSSEKKRYKILSELLYINEFFEKSNFSLVIVETFVREYRLLDGRGNDKKIKATKKDTVPIEIIKQVKLDNYIELRDYIGLLYSEKYTRQNLKEKFNLKGLNFSAAIKTLQKLGIIKASGKEERKIIYTVCGDENEHI